MERMTLREAAERTSRSITTLRRYIRSGKLHAEKRYGRFGPEYYVASDDLAEAGLDTEESGDREGAGFVGTALAPREPASPGTLPARQSAPADGVPLALYQELQMKHEQLLVQYGMMRASGVRALEAQTLSEELRGRAEAGERRVAKLERERLDLLRRLRESRLELEARALEIDALREKVRGLEMLSRNAVTNETIEKQFGELLRQEERVRELSGPSNKPAPASGERPPLLPDH